MIWKALNFTIELPDSFIEASKDVLMSSNPDKKRPRIKLFQEFASSREIEILKKRYNNLKTNKNVIARHTPYGFFFGSLKNMRFFCISCEKFHLPAFLSFFLITLVKFKGFSYDSFLIHSACVIRNNKAYLILGSQNSGKTTLCRNLNNINVLNDDLSLIIKIENDYFIYKVPDYNKLNEINPFFWDGPYKLNKLIFLDRNNKPGIYNLNSNDAKKYFLKDTQAMYCPVNELVTKTKSVLLSYHIDNKSFLEDIFLD